MHFMREHKTGGKLSRTQVLKKKRKIGQIPDGKYSFFDAAVSGAKDQAVSAFNEQLSKYIERAWNG